MVLASILSALSFYKISQVLAADGKRPASSLNPLVLGVRDRYWVGPNPLLFAQSPSDVYCILKVVMSELLAIFKGYVVFSPTNHLSCLKLSR